MASRPCVPNLEPEDECRLLKTIHHRSSEAIGVADLSGRLVFCNPAYQALFLSTDNPRNDIWHAPEWRDIWSHLLTMPNGERVWQGELDFLDDHGNPRKFRARLEVIGDASGRPEHMIALLHDITADAQAREALRLSEARYRGLVESQHDLVARLDAAGRIVYVNDACCRALGAPQEQIIGQPCQLLIFSNDGEEVATALARLSASRGHTYFERQTMTPRGPRWFGWEAYSIPDSHGSLGEIQCVGRDITNHKATEMALKNSTARARAFLRAMPDTIFVMTRDGVFTDYHTPDSSGLVAPLSALLGRHVSEVLSPDASHAIVEAGQRAFETGEAQMAEYAVVEDGETRQYEARLVAMDEHNLLTIVRDITERKQAEESLRIALERERELNGLKTRFVSMASHEFRTPLSTILSSVELIELYSDRLTEEKRQRYFKQIRTAASHMSDLLQDILLVGKMESGKVEFSPVPMQLSSLCAAVIEEAQFSIGRNHHLVFSDSPDSGEAWVDPKLLRHILLNLLSNAIAYSPEGSTVTLRLARDGDHAMFSVIDQGIGIPPEDQPHIFETFYRARNVGSIPGTGLGLVIVQRAINLHHGSLSFTSTVGQGTTFVVTIPTELQQDTEPDDDPAFL